MDFNNFSFSNKPKQYYLVLYFRDRIFKETIKGTTRGGGTPDLCVESAELYYCVYVCVHDAECVWARDTSRELLPRVKRSLSLPQQQWTHWSSLMVCLEEVDQSRRVNGKTHMFGKADINHAYTQSDICLSESTLKSPLSDIHFTGSSEFCLYQHVILYANLYVNLFLFLFF